MEGKRVAVRSRSAAGRAARAAAIGASVLIVLALALWIALSGYAACQDVIFPGVTMAGVDVAGMTPPEAEACLQRELPLWLDRGSVTVVADGEELQTFRPSELGAALELSGEVDAAMAVGREPGIPGFFKNGFTMGRCLLGAAPALEPTPHWEQGALASAAARLARQFDRAPLNGSWELDRTGLYAVKCRDGRALDTEALLASLPGTLSGVVEAPFLVLPALPLDLEALARQLPSQCSQAWYDPAAQKVMDGSAAVTLHVHAAAQTLEDAAPGQRVKLPADLSFPEYTAQELQAVLFRDTLGTASTKVGGTKVRKNNVRLSGESINGLVLNPGEEFDYNKAVGKRTTERGFGEAATYIGGKTVSTVGGGICQTSSTLYLSALLSNLEIVERHAHRFWPGYIEKGMDATVSWGGPEFKFRNNTPFPIRLDVTYKDDHLTCTIMGTKTDDAYVKMTHEVLSTTGYDTEYEETKDLPWGSQKQVQNGYTGYVVKSYRNVYKGDGTLLSSTLEDKSVYKNRNQIIAVGIAGRPEEEAPPADEPVLPDL